jgi:hypothetical protein
MKYLTCLLFLLLFYPLASLAQVPAPPPNLSAADLERRLNQLEAETQALRAEAQWLREHPIRLPAVEATPAGMASAPTAIETVGMAPVPAAPEAAQREEYFTLEELRGEMKKFAWKKGDFTVVPYGSLWGSTIFETERSFPGPYTLYVLSATTDGEQSFVIDTRRTRLGFDIAGPRIPMFHNALSYGKAEVDFHGAFVTENKPGVLLRHAYGEIKDNEFRLLAGQTDDVISPLYPRTLSYSVGWGGGNIGYRRAQVRLERYLACSDHLLWTVQGSINQNVITDVTSTGIRPESAGWPVIEGRVATTIGERRPGSLPITFGVSGHIGEQGFDFLTTGPPPLSLPPQDDVRRRTWSLNGDLYIPITERFGVQGEVFMGENLSTFLGGIIQGVSFETRNSIRSCGGWVDVWYDLTPRLHTRTGFGLDDPNNHDIVTGRSYNQYIYANASFDVTKPLIVGIEVTSWKTLYQETRPGQPQLKPGESVQFEITGKYSF